SISERDEVVLERLQLDAPLVGHVGDADFTEVRQPGFRTNRGEFGTVDANLVLALRPRVGERFDRRAWHSGILPPFLATREEAFQRAEVTVGHARLRPERRAIFVPAVFDTGGKGR